MSIVNLPIDDVKGVSDSIREKLPTRFEYKCNTSILSNTVCYWNETSKQVDSIASAESINLDNNITVPLFVFVGDAVKKTGNNSSGLFAVLGADGVVEIAVKDGATIEIGDAVIVADGGVVEAFPEAGALDKDVCMIGVALDSVSSAKETKIRVNTCLARKVTIKASVE